MESDIDRIIKKHHTINRQMNFKRFELSKLPSRDSIRVNNHGVPIGQNAYKALGSPERIAIYTDQEAQAIRLEAAEDGYKVSVKPAPHMSAKLCKVMPCGKYNAIGGGVFVLASQSVIKENGVGDASHPITKGDE